APVPLNFFPNPNAGEHFYTNTTSERDHLRSVGWRYEGIAWYAVGGGEQSHEDYRLLGRSEQRSVGTVGRELVEWGG
ncbi:hypothetical protein P7D64_22645, partial [Enterococcus raffinosus]|nr:hypothetical protein [Enterococcus raffinosus]